MGASSSASRRAARRSRERTRYWCGVTPSTCENNRRKWNGLMPACSGGIVERNGAMRIGVDPERRLHRAAAVAQAALPSCAACGPQAISTKRLARTWPTSSRPMSLLPSAAVCASSPSTISSGSGGSAPICQIAARSSISSTRSSPMKNDRHSSPTVWSWVQTYSSPGWPTSTEPVDQFVETAAAMAAETALAHIGDGVGRKCFRKRLVARSRGAAEFGHRNAVALKQRRAVHPLRFR